MMYINKILATRFVVLFICLYSFLLFADDPQNTSDNKNNQNITKKEKKASADIEFSPFAIDTMAKSVNTNNKDKDNISLTADDMLFMDDNDNNNESSSDSSNELNYSLDWNINPQLNEKPIIKNFSQLLNTKLYNNTDDINEHLGHLTYEDDQSKWFLEALILNDINLVSYLIDHFQIDLSLPLIKNMNPLQIAQKLNHTELKEFLIMKQATKSMTMEKFDREYFLNHKPSLVLFDWNDTILEKGGLVEGIAEFLYFLKKNKVKMAIVSNGLMKEIQRDLKLFAIDGFFEEIYSRDSTIYFKPSKKLADIVMKDFDGYDNNPYVWMFGDSRRDLDFATRNNFLPIGIKNSQIFNGFLNFQNYYEVLQFAQHNFFNDLAN